MNTQNYQELVNLYHNLNVYCAIAALIFLAAAIILFIKLKIPKVFGEWTGRTAQKAISEMSAEGAASGSLNSMRIGNDGRRQRRGRTGSLGTARLRKNVVSVTGSLATEQMPVQSPQVQPADTFGNEETDVLDNFGSTQTEVLDSYEEPSTDVLTDDTAIYQAPESETTVLNQMPQNTDYLFVVERSIVEIHTDEVI